VSLLVHHRGLFASIAQGRFGRTKATEEFLDLTNFEAKKNPIAAKHGGVRGHANAGRSVEDHCRVRVYYGDALVNGRKSRK
jgi:hypothetical protein